MIKNWVEFGPEQERMTVQKYREKVEAAIRKLVNSNFVLQKLKQGMEITGPEVEQLANLLQERDPWVTEELLKKVYDNKRATFIHFIRYILGMEELRPFTETVSEAFDQFIAAHNTWSGQQIQFLLTLKTFILQKGTVEKKDLVHEPFTKISPDGILGIFKPAEINEIMELTKKLVA
jgi:type I restriction enzyme R subunit